MATATKQDGMESITVRIPQLLLKEVDKVAQEEKKKSYGSPYSRSDAIRDLVREGLLARRKENA